MRKGIVRVGVVLAGLLLLMASLVYMSAAPALAGGATSGSESSQALAPSGGGSQLRPRPRTNTPTRTATRTPTHTPTRVNTPTNTPTSTPLPPCGLLWREVPAAHPATAIYGIEVISANDIWAVGTEYSTNPAKMLIEHWDGTQWSIVPAPNVGADVAYLFEVSAVSANDIWAIGTRGSARTLAIHWDGTSWSIVDTPNPGSHENYVTDVEAVSANDIWAVGYHRSAPTYASVPLAIHWDGTSWSIVPSPNPGTFSTALASVDSISANDVWAVGSTTVTSGDHAQTLAMHWDGSGWSVVPTGILQRSLVSVSAVSSNDVWAVGNDRAGLYVISMHWNGSTWSEVPTPDIANNLIYLNDLEAISSNDVWAVGYYESLTIGGYVPLMLHWDGTQWNEFERDWGIAPDFLTTVGAASSTDVWASGYNYTDGVFFLHYSEPCVASGAKR